ncbi:MAG: trehalose-6-phosphate synthase [Chloroflexi bacterium]|nr:trehalose-6-phosphate synthase [Chloroflexota bacterium]
MSTATPEAVIIANRGPNDFVWQDDAWVVKPAAGGLVSMLAPLARQPGVAWVCCVSEPPDAAQAHEGLYTTAADETDPGLHVHPVPLPASLYQDYYGRISNEVLWLLQHHLVGAGGLADLDARRHAAWSDGYLAANARLANAIARTFPTARAYLVHDYHLYPLPALLRRRCPSAAIIHFTHIPFPDPLLLSMLPRAWCETIVGGLLGADVVGLQTEGDVRGFLASCARFSAASVDYQAGAVTTVDGRRVVARAYPASVDPAALRALARGPVVREARGRLAPRPGQQTIVRVDRLDPSKNQIAGFQAFERLLQARPELRGRLRFLAFLVPSRTDLAIYRAYRNTVYALIDSINARYPSAEGEPPITVYYTNNREQALAALMDSDVLLVNSLADGMNLVAKEWAILSERPGALILSETAGAIAEAGGSALRVAPLDVEGTATALARALDMTTDERLARLAHFRARIERWTAADWLAAQFHDLHHQFEGNGVTMATTETLAADLAR